MSRALGAVEDRSLPRDGLTLTQLPPAPEAEGALEGSQDIGGSAVAVLDPDADGIGRIALLACLAVRFSHRDPEADGSCPKLASAAFSRKP